MAPVIEAVIGVVVPVIGAKGAMRAVVGVARAVGGTLQADGVEAAAAAAEPEAAATALTRRRRVELARRACTADAVHALMARQPAAPAPRLAPLLSRCSPLSSVRGGV